MKVVVQKFLLFMSLFTAIWNDLNDSYDLDVICYLETFEINIINKQIK